MLILRFLLATLLVCQSVLARASDVVPLHWSPPIFRWAYNPAQAPYWLTDKTAFALVERAVQAWEDCGPVLKFEGPTQRAAGAIDGVNVIGWSSDLDRAQRGLTRGRSLQGGILLERDVLINAQREEFRRFPRLLQKVITHEVGHALGLIHAQACTDVMSSGAICPASDPRTLPLMPTSGDMAACRVRYMRRGALNLEMPQ